MNRLCSSESMNLISRFIEGTNLIQFLNSIPDGYSDCIQLIDLLDETRKKWKKDIVKYSEENASLKRGIESMKLENSVLQDKLIQCQALLLDQEGNKTDDDVTVDSVESHATYTIKTGTAIDEIAGLCLDIETNDDEIENTHVVAFASSAETHKVNLPEITMTNLDTKVDSLGFKSEPKMNFQETPKLPRLALTKIRRSVSMPAPKSTDANLEFKTPSSKVSPSKRAKNVSYKEVVDNKNHEIHSRRIYTKQKCMTCKEIFKFGYYIRRCKDCKSIWHLTCELGPCVPFKMVPKTGDGKVKLTDCITEHKPRLPHPVRRCVVVLDKMLHSKKLYSTKFDEKAVKNLLTECIYSKNVDMPNAPEIVSNTLLEFLSELRDPLILKTSCDEFLVATESIDNDELYGAIDDLPKINRFTLAYLFLHWKNVVRNSRVNNLTTEKLGSIVMKVLMRIPEKDVLDQHIRTFERLLDLEDCVWEKIIEADCYVFPAKGSASTLVRAQSARDSSNVSLE